MTTRRPPRRRALLAFLLIAAALLGAPTLASAAPERAVKTTTTAPAFKRDTTPLSSTFGSAEQEEKASTSSSSGAAAAGRMLLGLVLVVGLVYAVYWVLKKVGKSKRTLPAGDGRIDVLATTPLATGRSLHLVRVGEDVVLVGSTEGGISALRVLEPEAVRKLDIEAQAAAAFRPVAAAPTGGASGLLEQLRRRTTR